MHRRVLRAATVAAAMAVAAVLPGCSSTTEEQPAEPVPTGTSIGVGQSAALVPTRIRNAGVLTVGIDPNYPPMEYLDRGSIAGADVDIMQAVADRLGLRMELVADSYALLVPGVKSGRFGAAISAVTVDPALLASARMVTYYRAGSMLAVRPPARKNFGAKNLCGKKVAVLQGSVQNTELSTMSANCLQRETRPKPIRIFAYKSAQDAIDALLNFRVYGFYADTPVVTNAAAFNRGKIVVHGKPTNVLPLGIAVPFRPGNDLDQAVQAALEELIDMGVYDQILSAWGIQRGGISKPLIISDRSYAREQEKKAEAAAKASASPTSSASPTDGQTPSDGTAETDGGTPADGETPSPTPFQ